MTSTLNPQQGSLLPTVAELILVRPRQPIFSCVLTSALISAALLPCAAQDQSETTFRKVVSALSGKWSIRETSDHGETTGEEVWQGGTAGMPLTEEFRAITASGEKLTDYAAVWRDGNAKKVRGIWCADFNDQGCTPFEVTLRGGDIEMKGEYDSKGKSTAWKEIFHITSATTFTQTLYMGAAGQELKKVSTIVAEKKPMIPERPNQSIEPTASRRSIQLSVTSARQSAATRALARGSSSWSR